MQQPIKIYKREALYINKRHFKKEQLDKLKEDYTFRFYEEKACKDCEYLEDRHCDICDNCAAYKGGTQLLKQVSINGNKMVSFPAGKPKQLISRLKKYRVGLKFKGVSKLPNPEKVKAKRKIKFLGELYDYQPEAVQACIDRKRGILKAPPRSGKTVMGTYLITELNGRALIVASQRDWLVGFYETFCGSATQKPLTDARGSGVTTKEINASRRSGERFDIGFCNTLEDFKRHDICLATVQTFQSPAGRKLLQKIRSRFKICMIDEVHYGAAPQFAKFISTMNVEYLIGLTGTDSRKDMRFVLMRELIGENVYEVKKEMLQPHVRLTRTKYKYLSKARQFNWVNFVTNLENDKARLKLIAETALRDVKDKHMVLIPLARVKAAKTLVDMINNLAGETIAVQFTGSIKKELRDKYIQDARNYKIKVMVGQAKILSTGINIPRASAIYEVTPSSNLENATQRIARILTPYEGKPTPILRFFLDDNNVRRNCYKNEWWKLIRPKFKPIIREKDAIIWNEYLKDTKSKANYLEF